MMVGQPQMHKEILHGIMYGAIQANCLCMPLADKMIVRNEEEKTNNELILDAIMGIQDGQNPKVIEGILRNYLAQSKREPAAAE